MKDLILAILSMIGIFLLIVLPIIFVAGLISNAQAHANCRLLEKNGHETHLETYWGFFQDCYVEGVPYDRYVLMESAP